MSETISDLDLPDDEGYKPPGFALVVQSNKQNGGTDTQPPDLLSTPNLLQDRFSQGQLANYLRPSYYPSSLPLRPTYATAAGQIDQSPPVQYLTAPRPWFVNVPEEFPKGGPGMEASAGDPTWWPMTEQPSWMDKFDAARERASRNIFEDNVARAAGIDVNKLYKADDLYYKLYGKEFPSQLGTAVGKALDPVQYLALATMAAGGEGELGAAALGAGEEAGGLGSALSKVTGLSPETLSDMWKDFKWQAVLHQFNWDEQNKPMTERIRDSISHAISGLPYGAIPHVGNEDEMRENVGKVLDWYGSRWGKDINGIIPKGLRDVMENRIGTRAIDETDMLLRKFAEWVGHGAVYRRPSHVAETETEPYAEPLVEHGAEGVSGVGSGAYQTAYDYTRMPTHYYPDPTRIIYARPDPWEEMRSPWARDYRLKTDAEQ